MTLHIAARPLYGRGRGNVARLYRALAKKHWMLILQVVSHKLAL